MAGYYSPLHEILDTVTLASEMKQSVEWNAWMSNAKCLFLNVRNRADNSMYLWDPCALDVAGRDVGVQEVDGRQSLVCLNSSGQSRAQAVRLSRDCSSTVLRGVD